MPFVRLRSTNKLIYVGFTRSHVSTRQATVRVHKDVGGLRVGIDPPKRDPAKRIPGSHLPVVPEKLICPQSTHTQTKYQ